MKILGPWDSYELTESDWRILYCNRSIGYFGNGASHGEKAAIEGIEALWKAADIIYSCDYEQRAMLCEALRQTLMHEDKITHTSGGTYTRLEFLRWEGELQEIDAKEEMAAIEKKRLEAMEKKASE